MAQLKDILETERLRADMAQCLRINLFKEGTFYRAYEWSAWLCVRYIKQFKPTHRLIKDSDDSIVFLAPHCAAPRMGLMGWCASGTRSTTMVVK